jgi:hypothetical protein
MNRTLRLGLGILLGSVLAVVALAGGVIAWQSLHSEDPGVVVPVTDRQAQLAKGQYLARAGNCMACHTVRGGAAYAGGRALPTPFGTIYTTNITPDRAISGVPCTTDADATAVSSFRPSPTPAIPSSAAKTATPCSPGCARCPP